MFKIFTVYKNMWIKCTVYKNATYNEDFMSGIVY